MRHTRSFRHCLIFSIQNKRPPGLNYGLYRSSGQGSANRKPAWTNFNSATSYEGRYSNLTVNTGIRDSFNSRGGLATNGSPYDNGGTAWVHTWDYGYVQDFNGGAIGANAIFNSASSTFQVLYGFWTTYLQGDNHTHLRFPTSDEFASGSGTRQNFQGGYMTSGASSGVFPPNWRNHKGNA